ncbi:uncharacterized protein LOC113566390 [Drosophila persimilis]|uniref:uncharacterized protein LOC113566390 n=1 Tax=Drosophila persimilis TaxID=7234 RepID=UPI000F0764FE|nr:uncharacterized protein LOC113566390 [Drosophila persimilis]
MAGCSGGGGKYPAASQWKERRSQFSGYRRAGGGPEGGTQPHDVSMSMSVEDLCRRADNVANQEDFERWKDIVKVRWTMYEEQRKYNRRRQSMPAGRDATIWGILSMVQQELEEKLQMKKMLGSCRRFPSPMALMDSDRLADGQLQELEVVRDVLCGTDEVRPEKKHQPEPVVVELQNKPLAYRPKAEIKWRPLTLPESLKRYLAEEPKPIGEDMQQQQPKAEPTTPCFSPSDPSEKSHRRADPLPGFLQKFNEIRRGNQSGLLVPANALLQLAEELSQNATWTAPDWTALPLGEERGMPQRSRPHRITDDPDYAQYDPLLLYVNEKFHLDAGSAMDVSARGEDSPASFYSALDVSEPDSDAETEALLGYCPLCNKRHMRLPPF